MENNETKKTIFKRNMFLWTLRVFFLVVHEPKLRVAHFGGCKNPKSRVIHFGLLKKLKNNNVKLIEYFLM